MSRLAGIPIRVEPPARVDGLGGGVTAILHEIVRLLERLAAADEPSAIDLRSLPMSPVDRVELKRVLGEGEVRATLNAEGISTIQETRIPGVWWIEHRNLQDQLIVELIDINCIPEILSRTASEIAAGARALGEQMTNSATVAAGRGGGSAGGQ